MKQYLDLCKHVLENGVEKSDRTGTGTLSTFGYQMRFNLQDGFPLVTTKKLHLRSIIYELLWFLKGDTNVKYLNENGVTIWNEWADENGDLGPIYGKQWRSWPAFDVHCWEPREFDTPNGTQLEPFWAEGRLTEIDQIKNVIEQIILNPDSRRLIVSSWNVAYLPRMALPPCHLLFQFYVANGKLSCHLYQRSADIFLGVPFNIASYALLTNMIAHVTGLQVGEFIHTLGDAHIYLNHIEQVNTQLQREPRPLPKLIINRRVGMIDHFKYEDFSIHDYNPHPAIKGDVSV